MSQPDLIRRAEAVGFTLARFKGKAFGLDTGRHCARMAEVHLKAMGLACEPVPRLRSEVGARRELVKRDCANMADWMDRQGVARIAPAMMLPGDVAYRASEGSIGGLLICAGPGKVMGWFDNPETDGRFCVMAMTFDQLETGWRL